MSERSLPLPGPLFAAHIIMTSRDKSFVVAAYKQLHQAIKDDHPDIPLAAKRVFVVTDIVPLKDGTHDFVIVGVRPTMGEHWRLSAAKEACAAYVEYMREKL